MLDANLIKVGSMVYHTEFGVGKVLMCSQDKKHCLVFFGFAAWVKVGDLRETFRGLKRALC